MYTVHIVGSRVRLSDLNFATVADAFDWGLQNLSSGFEIRKDLVRVVKGVY